MATRAQSANRRALGEAVKHEQRRIRVEALGALRSQIHHIKTRRSELVTRVRSQCARARARVRERVKARRSEVLAELAQEVAAMRQAERNRCQLRTARVRQHSTSARERVEAERRERVRSEAAARRIERHREKKLAAHEKNQRRGESDDEVRANLEAELVPIFDVVRAKVRPRPGMSRTEVFLHWLEENPGEAWAMREELAEKRLRALIREEQRAAREVQKAGGSAKARRARLEPAPF